MSSNASPLRVSLENSELRILRLCVNEVANGLQMTDDELFTRLGYTREELSLVLAKLRPAKDHKGPVVIDVSSPAA